MFFLFLKNSYSRAAWDLFDVGNQSVPTHLASNLPFRSFQCSLEGGQDKPLRCINVFFWSIGTSFSSGRGSFLVFSAPWHAGSPPGPRAQVWALVDVRGTCSGGSTWQVPSGRDSEHVEPFRPMQTHVHNTCDLWYILTWVKKCPTAHAISMILNVVNVARHYLVMETYQVFPNLRDIRPLLVQ